MAERPAIAAVDFSEKICSRTALDTKKLFAEKNDLKNDIKCYETLRKTSATGLALHSALEACTRRKDLEAGMKIHALAAASGDDISTDLADSLVQMYVKCGSLVDALQAFEKAVQASVMSWNALLSGYAEAKDFESALLMFARMQEEGCKPNAQTFIAALKACSCLADKEQGQKVHGKLVKLRCLETGFSIYSLAAKADYGQERAVANTIIHMFAKCGSMVDARNAFDRIRNYSAVSWNVLIFGYVEAGEAESALQTFMRMLGECYRPNALTFVAVLKACSSSAAKEEFSKVGDRLVKLRSLETGMVVYSQARRNGHDLDEFLANTAVDMYAKCGSLLDALQTFDRMQRHTVVSWNTLISGYADNGESEKALLLFKRMQRENVTPNSRTFVAAISACAACAAMEQGRWLEGRLVKVEALQRGRAVHSQAKLSGFELELHVANTLVHMYAKCGSLVDARQVFDRIPVRDLVSYNVLIFAYAESGDGEAALEIHSRLRDQGLKPSSLTYVAALKACAGCAAKEEEAGRLRCLATGRELHAQVVESGYETDMLVASTLLDMYSKCRSMVNAREVFSKMEIHDVVSWNAMIFGHEQTGEAEIGLEFYDRMKAGGYKPDALTYVAALKACASCAERQGDRRLKWLEKGREIHAEAEKRGYESDMFLASTLVDFYSKCRSSSEARRVFDRMDRHDVVSWNAVISGYAESGENEMCLDLFGRMQTGDEQVKPNALSYAAALKACGSLATLEAGKAIHGGICMEGLEEDQVVASSLVVFYGKCGSMVEAEVIFQSIQNLQENLVTWNALISGYAQQANSNGVFSVFKRMQDAAVEADGITFLAVLKGCSHAGLVEKGKEYFRLMQTEYRITPGIKHYTCMVDMLGRSNHLNEAVRMVKSMQAQADTSIWMSILGAAKKWKNVQVGKAAFEEIVKLDPREVPAHVIMGNIYAAAGMWQEKTEVRNRGAAL